LGTNDLFGNTTPEDFSANIKVMVDNIRSSDANIPIFVVLTILTGDQNGLGKQQSTDGFASYKGKYKYGLDCKFITAMSLLYETLKDYSNLYFVPLTECHDNEYNFGAVETAVNPRASQKEFMPNEGIHPQQQGYEQMADVMYSVYCRAFTT
jgi:lysophospholipase L1-like esterase